MSKTSQIGKYSLLEILKNVIPKDRSHRREFYHIFLQQVYFTFVQALPLLGILGITIGLGVAFQAKAGLSLLGKNDKIGQFLVIVLFREVAPLVSTMVLIARSVTAVTSEIATMKVQQEIQALHILGINIIEYIFAPRILSGMISLFCMATAFCSFALLGSWLGVNLDGHMSVGQLFDSISLIIRPADLIFFLTKSSVIGFMVLYIGCKKGLALKKAAFEVPIVTNLATVRALFVALTMQAVISGMFYLIYGIEL